MTDNTVEQLREQFREVGENAGTFDLSRPNHLALTAAECVLVEAEIARLRADLEQAQLDYDAAREQNAELAEAAAQAAAAVESLRAELEEAKARIKSMEDQREHLVPGDWTPGWFYDYDAKVEDDIGKLTARAEKAEAERDAAIDECNRVADDWHGERKQYQAERAAVVERVGRLANGYARLMETAIHRALLGEEEK